MRSDSCPACGIDLEHGQTHCPRCGLRVATLPRNPAATEHGEADEGLLASVLRGLLAGAVLFGVAFATATLLALRNGGFSVTLDNTSFILGGLALCAAFLMGGVRTGVLNRGLSVEQRLSAPTAVAPRHARVVVAVAGGLCMLLAVALLPLT